MMIQSCDGKTNLLQSFTAIKSIQNKKRAEARFLFDFKLITSCNLHQLYLLVTICIYLCY